MQIFIFACGQYIFGFFTLILWWIRVWVRKLLCNYVNFIYKLESLSLCDKLLGLSNSFSLLMLGNLKEIFITLFDNSDFYLVFNFFWTKSVDQFIMLVFCWRLRLLFIGNWKRCLLIFFNSDNLYLTLIQVIWLLLHRIIWNKIQVHCFNIHILRLFLWGLIFVQNDCCLCIFARAGICQLGDHNY
jgi:hypothetical protein